MELNEKSNRNTPSLKTREASIRETESSEDLYGLDSPGLLTKVLAARIQLKCSLFPFLEVSSEARIAIHLHGCVCVCFE